MQVKSIAECSTGAFFNTFDLHFAIVSLQNIALGLFLLKTDFTVHNCRDFIESYVSAKVLFNLLNKLKEAIKC